MALQVQLPDQASLMLVAADQAVTRHQQTAAETLAALAAAEKDRGEVVLVLRAPQIPVAAAAAALIGEKQDLLEGQE